MKEEPKNKKKSFDIKEKEGKKFDDSAQAQAKRTKDEEKARQKIKLIPKIKEKFIDVFNLAAIIFSELMAVLTGLAILIIGYIAITRLAKATNWIDIASIAVACVLMIVFANINERIR